ncbi:hypothetical protein Y1Q_0021557 [Alligator mississippiensis]|uniref:Uncharacterized protein n=1 Tax=Alligator mississippiensis TaxID=8496 RepID=A0A151PA73_ALLMI|nr:hypothetical protein Y1Q_0021557 [Alligator mississippiensis]
MTKETFYHTVSMLEPNIVRQDTNMHWPIPPDKTVAMGFMKLATLCSLCYIVNQFGMAPCMAGVKTREVCQLLNNIVANKFICLGNLKQVIDGFNDKGSLTAWGL